MPKLCAPLTFTSKRIFFYRACWTKASCECRFPRMTSNQGQIGQEENFVFVFWLTTGENIDFTLSTFILDFNYLYRIVHTVWFSILHYYHHHRKCLCTTFEFFVDVDVDYSRMHLSNQAPGMGKTFLLIKQNFFSILYLCNTHFSVCMSHAVCCCVIKLRQGMLHELSGVTTEAP